MKYRYDPSGRSINQPGQSQFPGISDPFFDGGMSNTTLGNNPIPYDESQFSAGIPSISIQPAPTSQALILPSQESTEAAKPAKAGGFNLGNSLNDIKGIVDRMGGIDGIVTTMTKVKEVVGSISQMAPLIKVLAGSFKKDTASIAEDDDDTPPPRRKKKRRRTRTGAGVTPGGQRRRPRKR
ncbi:tyrosine protein kinase [Paenibacillus solisilvae]|uniref:Tyrosine protein kinase n=1 Tax=Paenibacillus solisilvae TaxID=2486751 RepID=A0ABW0W1T1_9BACL